MCYYITTTTIVDVRDDVLAVTDTILGINAILPLQNCNETEDKSEKTTKKWK